MRPPKIAIAPVNPAKRQCQPSARRSSEKKAGRCSSLQEVGELPIAQTVAATDRDQSEPRQEMTSLTSRLGLHL